MTDTLFAEIEEKNRYEDHLEFLKRYFGYIPEVGMTGQFNEIAERDLQGNSKYIYCEPYKILEKLPDNEWVVISKENVKYKIKTTALWPDIYDKYEESTND